MKAILSVSFGTSHEDTRVKTIDVIDSELAAAFPDRAFYSAWTSPKIIAKVRAERGEEHDTLEEAFARLSADGVDDLVVGTMCLMPGYEMARVQEAVDAWVAPGGRTVRLAAPLLAGDDDRRAVAQAIADEFADVPVGEAVMLMGHGSAHKGNQVYSDLQAQFDALGKGAFVVGTVEGTPTFEDAAAKLKGLGVGRVHLAPLMVVAGDHAKNDLAGDDGDSWASQLQAMGFQTIAHLKGLGEYAGIRALACDHARNAAEIA